MQPRDCNPTSQQGLPSPSRPSLLLPPPPPSLISFCPSQISSSPGHRTPHLPQALSPCHIFAHTTLHPGDPAFWPHVASGIKPQLKVPLDFFFFGTPHYSMWVLVPQPGIKPVSSGWQILNHGTTREVPPPPQFGSTLSAVVLICVAPRKLIPNRSLSPGTAWAKSTSQSYFYLPRTNIQQSSWHTGDTHMLSTLIPSTSITDTTTH